MHQHHEPNSAWGCDRVRDELEAWSLGALDPAEASAVNGHLALCGACRHEAAGWRRVAGMLPFSLQPVSPSASAKQALMARIAEDQVASSLPAPAPPRPTPAPSDVPVAPTAQRRFHWSQLLVAPLAIALLVMTLWAFELQRELDEAAGDRPQLISAMAPSGLQSFQLQSECEQCDTAGRMLADPAQAEALMVAWNLDPGELHEVWCEEGNGSRKLVANLEANDTGEVVQSLSFDQPIAGYKRILVISEDGEVVEIRMSDLPGVPATPETTAGVQ